MSSNYGFMKSGVSTLEEQPLTSDEINNLYAMVYSFMEKALISADKYVQHSGRTIITKRDIQLGLKSETFKFIQRPDFMTDIQRWRTILQEEESDEEVESSIADGDYVEFTESSCNCSECEDFNTIEVRWTGWEPHNQIETILKRAILSIE
tara:strand:- start:868 stop:1320 length:453 start_codon:yes stop_codon:yes gene_type:complete